jgi:hypothetical protein
LNLAVKGRRPLAARSLWHDLHLALAAFALKLIRAEDAMHALHAETHFLWRQYPVMQMVGNRPRPLASRSYDDHYVRVDRRFLLMLIAADDDEEGRDAVLLEQPKVCRAHLLHYLSDIQRLKPIPEPSAEKGTGTFCSEGSAK